MLHSKFQDPELERMAAIAALLDAEMVNLLPNPTGAGYFSVASYGGTDIVVEIDSTVSGNTPLGTLVEVLTPYTGPGTAAKATPVTVQPSSTTADNLLLGVVVGGGNQDSATAGVAPGQPAIVKAIGLAQVLMDATSVAGQAVIQSAATAGAAKCDSSAPTNGQGIGTALQAVTISSGTALVWCLLKPQ